MNALAGKIQDSELEVMRVLWKAGEAVPLIEIRRILSQKCGWEDSTIKTLLRRLQAKGIVRLERRGVYGAVVTQREYDEWSTQAFLDKIFAGSAQKLMASLVSGGKLSEEDVGELSRMLRGGKEKT
jgi:BlaI family penicillinase repressor